MVTKSGTVPAKYSLSEAGLELARKLIRVENSMNGSPSIIVGHNIPTSIQEKSEGNSTADISIRQSNLLSQEVVEDLEARLPKPWLPCQEDGNLANASKNSTISLKEKLSLGKEVITSDKQPSLNSKDTQPSVDSKNIYTLLSGDPMLPGNPVTHNSVQSDKLRYNHVDSYGSLICLYCSSGNAPQFWYVDNESGLVHEKNKAAILFDS